MELILRDLILDDIFYVVGNNDIPLQLLQSDIVDSFRCCDSTFLFRTQLKSLWISKHNVLHPACISSAETLPVPGDLYLSTPPPLKFWVKGNVETALGWVPCH
jgi:hypothetical protein